MVLIVEDQRESAEFLKLVFEERGYKAVVVDCGEECLKEVVQKNYQIILLDVQLPGINGVETLQRIKQLRPDVGVIMMTGHAAEDLLQKAMQEGSYACIRKPLQIDSLVETIGRCLNKERQSGPDLA